MDDVLDRAAQVFWRDGFEAASIQNLESATGLGRGSLYNSFGDKTGLFLRVLDRYSVTESAMPQQFLADADAYLGLRGMLRFIAARMDQPCRPRGCLITNTCVGSGTPAEIEARVAESLNAMQAALEAAFRRAQVAGQLPATADVTALARFYGAVVRGIGVTHRAGADLRALNDVIDVALDAWPGQRSG